MKALLLAAGMGTRLRPLTDTIPKCLVPIHGRPLLEYWLEMLTNAGVGPLLVNLHYLHEKVEEFLSLSPYAENVCSVFEEHLLGTGGTLLKNRPFFGNGPMMLVHADNLSRFDVGAFIERHNTRPVGCVMTMMTFETDAPETCGIVEFDERGVVLAFHEKVSDPPGNLANGAVYILEQEVFGFMETLEAEFVDFSTQVLPHFLGRIHTFHNNGYHRDIGNLDSYSLALEEFPLQGYKAICL